MRSLLLVKAILIISLVGSAASADITSSVWSTGIASGANGSFGTAGSISSNTLAATITTLGHSSNVTLQADNGDWFRTDVVTIANDELAPIFENNAPMTHLTFTSEKGLKNVDMLVHNVWNVLDTRVNYLGNFTVTYADGLVVNNAIPTIRKINVDSPFSWDFDGGTLQPSDIPDAFDDGNNLVVTNNNFEPGNGAPTASYLYDPSASLQSESQGSSILSFDDSLGEITKIEFDWIGNTVGTNTAFVGFAGTIASVPEPGTFGAIAFLGLMSLTRRRRA